MRIKNKKAMLLASQVLKIVLAVLGIALLVYLLFALYNAGSNSEDLKKAKSVIEQISGQIILINTNNVYIGTVPDMTPNGWSMFSFVGSSVKPNICSGQDCLCICNEVYSVWGLLGDRQQKECDKKGACLVIKDLKDFGEIPIQRSNNVFTSIEIKKSGKWIEVNKI